MFKLDDEERSVKEKVLEEIMNLMDKHDGQRLGGLKKPSAVEVSVEKMEPLSAEETEEETGESPEEQAVEESVGAESTDGQPSDEEKAKIAELYHKYVK